MMRPGLRALFGRDTSRTQNIPIFGTAAPSCTISTLSHNEYNEFNLLEKHSHGYCCWKVHSHSSHVTSMKQSWRGFSSTSNNNDYQNNKTERIINNNDNSPRLSVAVVGAGPSGFYAAKYLTSSVLKRIQQTSTEQQNSAISGNSNSNNNNHDERTRPAPFGWKGIDIDLIERLPTPYGLVRYGVAPDHPEVKNVEHDFAALFQSNDVNNNNNNNSNNNNSSNDGKSSISYYGNISVGKDISLSHLQSIYDIVILAYGCQAADKQLGIPGEDSLEGVMSAREFVAWYNGHPEFGHVGPIVERCLWPSTTTSTLESNGENKDAISPARVVVIGQGNVALDCARILAKGQSGLRDTDTPSSVLDILKGGVSHVSVVGRRGHVQGAFTIKELRELTKLKEEGNDNDVSFVVRKEELDMGMTDASKEELKGAAGRPKTRIDKLLQDAAKVDHSVDGEPSKQIELRFLMSPTCLEPYEKNDESNASNNRVGKVICERTKLQGEPFQQKAISTNEKESLPADLVLVSIGYRGMPLDGMMEKDSEMFDNAKGTVANDHGKVKGSDNLFVTGWIKRGATGIIGTNIMDAKDTVQSVMAYIESQSFGLEGGEETTNLSDRGRGRFEQYLQSNGLEFVNWKEFQNIESLEKEVSRLRSEVQPREKILSVDEMLLAAKKK